MKPLLMTGRNHAYGSGGDDIHRDTSQTFSYSQMNSAYSTETMDDNAMYQDPALLHGRPRVGRRQQSAESSDPSGITWSRLYIKAWLSLGKIFRPFIGIGLTLLLRKGYHWWWNVPSICVVSWTDDLAVFINVNHKKPLMLCSVLFTRARCLLYLCALSTRIHHQRYTLEHCIL